MLRHCCPLWGFLLSFTLFSAVSGLLGRLAAQWTLRQFYLPVKQTMKFSSERPINDSPYGYSRHKLGDKKGQRATYTATLLPACLPTVWTLGTSKGLILYLVFCHCHSHSHSHSHNAYQQCLPSSSFQSYRITIAKSLWLWLLAI